jgi:hypothetical protein
LVNRAFDDSGKPGYVPDHVPADSAVTSFVDMGRMKAVGPSGYLWTHGLATCIAVAVYGQPFANGHSGATDRSLGGKILAHISPNEGRMRDLLKKMDDTIATHPAMFPNPVVKIIAPNPIEAPEGGAPFTHGAQAAMANMLNSLWNHFNGQINNHGHTAFETSVYYHTISFTEEKNGEVIVWGNNYVTVDADRKCV